jgi:hypothetical protein
MSIWVDRDGRHVYIRKFTHGKPVECQVEHCVNEPLAIGFIKKFLVKAHKRNREITEIESEKCYKIAEKQEGE